MDNKTYLFISYTDFKSGKLTGAHRRFLELVKSISAGSNVILIADEVPQLSETRHITRYDLLRSNLPLPKHICGMVDMIRSLMKARDQIRYDYAVSFGPVSTICYRVAGIRNIVSLFREDLIGYQQALLASKKKLAYFRLQERLAVKASQKIIVQCENDRRNLISRNEKHCKNLAEKVFIQINNANASWMDTEPVDGREPGDVPKVLFIGNFSDRRKGHFILLPAVMRLLDEGHRFELLVAGGGKELQQWQRNCENYPAIHFLGQISNISHYLQQADFMVVPSLIDSCPNTVLEGLNAGIAVYGANTGGIPDLLQEKAYLFEPDAESVYRFLQDVLAQKRYLADRQRQKVRKESLTFDWGKQIQSIIEA